MLFLVWPVICLLVLTIEGRPSTPAASYAVVATSKNSQNQDDAREDPQHTSPYISRFHVTSHVQFRYAHTLVSSYVKNPTTEDREISFTAVIPDNAFISNFSMVIAGEEFVAEVKEKAAAEREYSAAVVAGTTAGLVSQDVRDANRFSVAANVEAGDKVEFRLTYGELLERKLGQYELALNVNPGQVVEDLKIEVHIDESLPLSFISVPELKESNDIFSEPDQQSQVAEVETGVGGDRSRGLVLFQPSMEEQEEAGEQGLAGQLLVRYDVDRQGQESEVQVIDGYFVHYFTPENLPVLPKHVIFVLDVSGSMDGEKISQLKDAMFTILDDMTEKDYFNIITFSSWTEHWSPAGSEYFKEARAIQGTKENRDAAIEFVIGLTPAGGTNINEALLEGLRVASAVAKKENLARNAQSTIVFLSDGGATEGETDRDRIRANVKKANSDTNVLVYSLGFGSGADFDLIKGISNDAGGFSKQIYEDSDAALQLENFFLEIANPVLSDLTFNYVAGGNSVIDHASLTDLTTHSLYKGGEFVVTGQLKFDSNSNDILEVVVDAVGEEWDNYHQNYSICLGEIIGSCSPPHSPQHHRSEAQNFLQKLHAFLNIKQLLKRKDASTEGEESPKDEALRLSLANNFVTEMTSLVVVRPDAEPAIAAVDIAEKITSQLNTFSSSANYFAGAVQQVNSFSLAGGAVPHIVAHSAPIYESFGGYETIFGGYDYYDFYPSLVTTTTTPVVPCSGSLTLFSRTYHRGENLTLTEDIPDLTTFNNQVVSVLVEGDCCWTVYTGAGYTGRREVFRQEETYGSVVSVGDVFRRAVSAKKNKCH